MDETNKGLTVGIAIGGMLAIVIIVTMFVIVFMVVVPSQSSPLSTLTPPRFSLSDGNTRTETALSGSTAWYDVGVRNLGGDGYQTIYCQFTQGSTQVTRQQTVYLRAGEYTVVTFEFREYSIWSTSRSYCRAWV